jgi:hypothetical protein
MPDPEFAALKGALTLSIVEAKRTTSGGAADFSFKLTNRERECEGVPGAIAQCVPQGRVIEWHQQFILDHPGCTREFTIQPGGVMSWAETLEVPRLSQGRVEVEVSVQIVNRGGAGAGKLRSD